jgi:hypothetical protein
MNVERTMTTDSHIANIEEYEPELFELYKRFRYNELICDHLRHDAMRIEKWVRWSVVATVAISFLSGGEVTFLHRPGLAPLWALITALATILSIYSMIVGSGTKQFFWFSLSIKLRSGADEVEFFSRSVKLGKITEDELMVEWRRFREKLSSLLEQASLDLREFDAGHKSALQDEFEVILQSENKAALVPPAL